MQIVIGDVLKFDELAAIREALEHARFVDGKDTAGFAARRVKDNRQADSEVSGEADRSAGALSKHRRRDAERQKQNAEQNLGNLVHGRKSPDQMSDGSVLS